MLGEFMKWDLIISILVLNTNDPLQFSMFGLPQNAVISSITNRVLPPVILLRNVRMSLLLQ